MSGDTAAPAAKTTIEHRVGVYAKAAAGVVVAGLGAAITALEDGRISGAEWIAIVVAALVALGAVWAIPSLPDTVRRYGKEGAAGVIAGLGVIATALTGGGVTAADILTAIGALIVGSGLTGVTPNARTTEVSVTARRAAPEQPPAAT